MTRLERFRAHKDEFFKEDHHSPLLPEQQERFTGLAYYPERPDLRFELTLDGDAVEREAMVLDTTTGEQQEFIRAGVLRMEIEGQQVSMTVFRESGRGRFFLPFHDATSGVETYKLGRYLDPQEAPGDKLIVDFNYAYNPYCAYNDQWSCPIPPEENHVDVPIRAGEKAFELT